MNQVPLNLWMFTPYAAIISVVLLCVVVVFSLRKGFSLLIDVKTQICLILFFLVFFLLFNPFLSENWMHGPFAIMFAMSCSVLSFACVGRWAIGIWIPIFLAAFVSYGLDLNNVILNETVMVQIIETSEKDALRYASVFNVFLVIISVVLAIVFSCVLFRLIRSVKRISLFSYGCVSLVVPLVGMYVLRSHMPSGVKLLWPMFNMQEFVVIYKNSYRQLKAADYILSLLPDDSKPIKTSISTVDKDSGLVCILHIGESVNADHCSFNGYSRNTTPWLASQPNLINFKDCTSSSGTTDWAVLTMVTNGRRSCQTESDSKMLPSSPSLMDFFHANGFRCFGFWDKCYVDGSSNNIFTKMVNYFCRCAEAKRGYEDDVMNQLRDVINTLDSTGESNVFMIINNEGSHCYYNGYDKENPPFVVESPPLPNFTPQSNKKHAEIFRNAYDSTIHYTDMYISRIVEHLKGRPFIYVYMSDHGEYLGEEGSWCRGSADLQLFHKHRACKVPFFIYASPEFESLHPHFAQAIVQLRKSQSIHTGHEHLFHTMLGIMGITCDYYDESLDLSKEGVEAYSGPHPNEKSE